MCNAFISWMGEHLIRRYGWPVKMKKFDMEVLVNVNNDDATIGINLTEESLHKRNIIHFGPTTLRSTLAHCMLRYYNVCIIVFVFLRSQLNSKLVKGYNYFMALWQRD